MTNDQELDQHKNYFNRIKIELMVLRAVLKYLFLNKIRRGFLLVSPLKTAILILNLLVRILRNAEEVAL